MALLRPSNVAQPVPDSQKIAAQFAWTEYEQLMISEAIHRGEIVYNVALRIDPNSLMHAAAFQLIRNVLHGCGTVIALRPEDNICRRHRRDRRSGRCATQLQPEERIAQRCRIPSIVSEFRIERGRHLEDPRARIARRNSGSAGRLETRSSRTITVATGANTAAPRSRLPWPKVRSASMPRASMPS